MTAEKYLRLWVPQEDVEYVAQHLRPEDAREAEAATGGPAVDAVRRGARLSTVIGCAGFKGRPPFLLFGVAPCDNPKIGAVWLLATEEVTRASLWVAKRARQVLPTLFHGFDQLHNMADARNVLHIRWLQLMGFTFGGKISLNGQTFRYFHMSKEDLCANQPQSSLA